MKNWMIGADVSSLSEVEFCGGKFYNHGQQGDALSILRDYGVNTVRLRLWNDPYSPVGVPYGAGNCDLKRVIALSTPERFCSFSPNRGCRKKAGKRAQPLNNYTCRFCPSSLKQADKSGLDGLQIGK